MAFPTTPVLDAFPYANGALDTVGAANWDNDPFGSGATGFSVSSNRVTTTLALGNDSAYFLTSFRANQEAYYDIVTAGNYNAVFLRIQQPGVGGDGYIVEVEGTTFQVFRMDNGVGTTVGSGTVTALASGDAFGASMIGSTIQACRRASGVWATYGPAVVDATYQGPGFIGMALEDHGVRPIIDGFGGGSIPLSSSGIAGGMRSAMRRRRR